MATSLHLVNDFAMRLQTSDRPLFTIVTISYNQADFVRETVESILNQEFSDYEYIIWDGGSSDGSIEILRS